MQNIRRTALILIPALLVFAALYVVYVGGETFVFAFLETKAWHRTGWVSDGATLPWWHRATYFAVWIAPVVFGLWAVVAAIRLLLLMRRGVLFDAQVCRLLRHVGLGTALSGLADFVANLLDPMVLSLSNPAGPVGMIWYFDSEPAGLIMCGGGFYLIGWVLTEARKIADENEGFV